MIASTSPDLLRIVVFASGRGSNFNALLNAQKNGELPIEICALLSDKRTAPALSIAENAGIPTIALRQRDFPDRRSFDTALFARAAEFKPDLIVLAGFMRVIDTSIVEQWCGRMINIHPSLLPKYRGLNTHERAIEAGDDVHGASVHYVTPELDGGPVISQVLLTVRKSESPSELAARLLPLEQRLLTATVRRIAQHRVELGANGVHVDGRAIDAPLQLDSEDVLSVGVVG
jgi:phosphoribosylglycinamide formyltransferase 1